LGEDALLIDALPFSYPQGLEEMVNARLNEMPQSDERDKARAIFREWSRNIGQTYKFIDVPLTIERSPSGLLYAVRSEKKWPISLRRKAFLSFQSFDSSFQPTEENNPPFYPIVPMLTEAWPAFSRLNDFAEVLALVRWLVAYDATWLGGLEEPSRGAVLTTFIANGADGPKLTGSLYELNLALAERVRQKGLDIVSKAPAALAKVNDEIHQHRLERLEIRETMAIWRFGAIERSELERVTRFRSGRVFRDFVGYAPTLGEALDQQRAIIRQTSRDLMLLPNRSLWPLLSKALKRHLLRLSGTPDPLIGILIDQFMGREATISEAEVSEAEADWRDSLAEEQEKWKKMVAVAAESKAGKLFLKLEDLESKAAEASPLSEGKRSLRARLVTIPDDILETANKLEEEARLASQRKEELSQIRKTMGAQRRTEDGVDEALLLAHVATDAERQSAQELATSISVLDEEVADSETGFMRRLKARWERYQAESDREDILSEFDEIRIMKTLADFGEEITELAEKSVSLAEEAREERLRVADSIPLPGFDSWWKLQTSYRDQVFHPSRL